MKVDDSIAKLDPNGAIVILASGLKNGWSVHSSDREESKRITTALTDLSDYVDKSIELFGQAGNAIEAQQKEIREIRMERDGVAVELDELNVELREAVQAYDEENLRVVRAQKLMRKLLWLVKQEDTDPKDIVAEVRELLEEHQ